MEESKKPCRFCLNARVDGELSDDNDLSYLPLGFSIPGFSLYMRSGGGRPVQLLSEVHDPGVSEWVSNSVYYPKFCPECGRPLMDDYPERRSVYGKKESE